MREAPYRLAEGGRIDRSARLSLTFDGRSLDAFAGDTLASALLAHGERVVARSFKYHRPRGVYSAGVEEPNALANVGEGARQDPNTPATIVEAYDRLAARGQNAWPNVRFDLGAVNQLFSPFLRAGFYYKTFFGPGSGTGFWMICEKFIRAAAGMGKATIADDPDSYEKVNAFADLLVIGGGPSGLAAALAAGRAGVRVILCEQDFALGGSLLSAPVGSVEDGWLRTVTAELATCPNVRVLTRTTAFGAYDGSCYGLVERVADHLPQNGSGGRLRQRFWLVRAGNTVLASGATERPLVFAGNDLPGVMLAGAVRTYISRFAVLPGRRSIVATNNDGAYPVALALAKAGAEVTLVDARDRLPAGLTGRLQEGGVAILPGTAVVGAEGGHGVRRVTLAGASGSRKLACDLVAISGGWSPALHLWSHRGGRPAFSESADCYVPHDRGDGLVPVGAALGPKPLAAAAAEGFTAGVAAAKGDAGIMPALTVEAFADDWSRDIKPVRTAGIAGKGKAFVDLQHDVTLADIEQAHAEGFVSVEHLKRYTTTGMAADQGKTSNVNALASLAALRGRAMGEIGTTTFRPPYAPVSIGALVGHHHGRHFNPTRLSPMHDRHLADGAVMVEAGAWMRPWYYPSSGSSLAEAYAAEAAHVREHVGMIDVSTLGKIAVQGPDAAEFLDRVYVNGWKTLAVGKVRYGVMLREDGFVLDDGTTARIGEHEFLMTTTTVNAGKVLSNLEHLLQTAWRQLKVHVTSVTDQWATIALAGPKSRDVLRAAVVGADVSAAALPGNGAIEAGIAGVPVRIHRISYSGELAYEIYIPARFGTKVWDALRAAGEPFRLQPYGTEAMGALRIEKGHVAGAELDGRTTLKDLGMEGLASRKKPFIGSVLRNRPVLADPARPVLVGLEIKGGKGTKSGALLFATGLPTTGHGEGHVTSTTFSPALGRHIALALLSRGAERDGEIIRCVDFVGGTNLAAKVTSPHFFDPEGVRQNA